MKGQNSVELGGMWQLLWWFNTGMRPFDEWSGFTWGTDWAPYRHDIVQYRRWRVWRFEVRHYNREWVARSQGLETKP